MIGLTDCASIDCFSPMTSWAREFEVPNEQLARWRVGRAMWSAGVLRSCVLFAQVKSFSLAMQIISVDQMI